MYGNFQDVFIFLIWQKYTCINCF